jgi:ribonucleoside-diphosphate reductase alpha chain
MNSFSKTILAQKYLWTERGETEWEHVAYRVTKNVLGALGIRKNSSYFKGVFEMIKAKKFMPGGRYLYASGRPLHQVQNCALLRAEDSREGWADHMQKNTLALMTGAGVGTVYSDLRPRGAKIRRTGGEATGPLALMSMTNEAGRGIMQGGSRRSALWAGLHWNHKDIMEFIRMKDWSPEVRAMKEKDYNFPATMDGTNISVILDTEFFKAYNDEKHPMHVHAHSVYWTTARQMLKTAEPGFSIDCGENEGENLRNACTEVTSKDDSDICNLGSINMANIENLEDMDNVVRLSTLFLLAGTVYSDVPYAKIDQIRNKNRRLGLGLMGLHEWLLQRGKAYGPDDELASYMFIYSSSTDVARAWAKEYELSPPVKTRAVAPTGTISIISETTGGVEPIFCAAFKRRYLKGRSVHYQYVIDPTAKRLIDAGLVDPDKVEDAYSITPERRVEFQAWLQRYVDHAISSTINLPSWGSETNNENTVQQFGTMLMKYLPQLRGLTTYPDGARGNQPISTVSYKTAIKHIGQDFVEGEEQKAVVEGVDICDITGKGGPCGT